MIIAAIPVKNQLKWTAPLIEGLLIGDEIDQLWIYDNGSTDNTKIWLTNRSRIDSRIKYVDAGGSRIYDMWNNMILTASKIEGAKLAILNNDIRLPFMALKSMSQYIGEYKALMIDKKIDSFSPIQETFVEDATWRDRTGWAFMIDPEFWKGQDWAIHPGLKFWWGDDDLFRRCQTGGGKIGIVRGVGCSHAKHSSDDEYPGDRIADIEYDKQFFKSLWR
jgi:GT2 family glycosyltransferase